MAWYRNHYTCDRCHRDWEDEWSCTCDDDCPHCGARHMSPGHSDELTEIIVHEGDEYVVLRSPKSAGHYPDYREIRRFKSEAQAIAYLKI